MKYTFECSETEVTELYGLLGLIAKEIGKTVRHSNELKARHAVAPQETHRVADMPTVDDCDGGEADVLPFPPRVVSETVRPTEQESEIANEPEPFPAAVVKEAKTLALGEKKFTEFLHTWLKGINMETMGLLDGVEQPNRELLLRELCNSPFAFPVLAYVKSKGGLQQAIFAVTNDKALARRLPDFIVPPASIVFSDLADTYEYTNPWKDEE